MKKIHLIGICGSAMGTPAAMLSESGYMVKGSDPVAYPPMSTWLAERSIEILDGFEFSEAFAETLDADHPRLLLKSGQTRALGRSGRTQADP